MRLLAFFFQVWIALLSLCHGKSELEIKTASGTIRGLTVPGTGGKTVDAFLGVPYGAPTSGQNRFAPPKKAEPWNDVFDASKFSQPCYQNVPKEVKASMWWVSSNEESEDCLKLNIWVPKPRPQKAAVMVWIHGGGFSAGSSDIPNYSGAVLASQENVIVVSLNHRLHAFGFLYLGHPLAPGNVGLLDQTLGLKWVHENIEYFGGDPQKVTLFGQSAGGASITFHLLSPASLDLFQNAIALSGTVTAHWPVSEADDAVQQALLLAEQVGCPTQKDKVDDIIRCLQKVPAEKLNEAAVVVDGGVLKMKFRPVVDGKILKESPVKRMSEGKFCSSKNVMIGYTREDGSFVLPILIPQLTKLDPSTYTNDELNQLVSSLTVLNEEISGLPVELISLLYSDCQSAGVSLTFEGILKFLTDRWFACPSKVLADKLVENGNNVFAYRFDHVPAERDPAMPLPPWLGSAHGDDVPHLLGHSLREESPGSHEEVRLTKKVMRYWANFAKKGDPNDDYLPTWPKYTSENATQLRLDSKSITVARMERLKQCAFWENIFPEIESAFKNRV